LCTFDSCDPSTGKCSYLTIPGCTTSCKSDLNCNDGNACTAELCLGGVCQSKQKNCDDGHPCTSDYCDSATGACSNKAIAGCQAKACDPASPGACEDGNMCTIDSCSLAGWCVSQAVPWCK
jgi:hypothetical protein